MQQQQMIAYVQQRYPEALPRLRLIFQINAAQRIRN
jgi:hypothetical protein